MLRTHPHPPRLAHADLHAHRLARSLLHHASIFRTVLSSSHHSRTTPSLETTTSNSGWVLDPEETSSDHDDAGKCKGEVDHAIPYWTDVMINLIGRLMDRIETSLVHAAPHSILNSALALDVVLVVASDVDVERGTKSGTITADAGASAGVHANAPTSRNKDKHEAWSSTSLLDLVATRVWAHARVRSATTTTETTKLPHVDAPRLPSGTLHQAATEGIRRGHTRSKYNNWVRERRVYTAQTPTSCVDTLLYHCGHWVEGCITSLFVVVDLDRLSGIEDAFTHEWVTNELKTATSYPSDVITSSESMYHRPRHVLVTPPIHTGALPGVTRARLIRAAIADHIPLILCPIPLHVPGVVEVYVCNAIRGVVRISTIFGQCGGGGAGEGSEGGGPVVWEEPTTSGLRSPIGSWLETWQHAENGVYDFKP